MGSRGSRAAVSDVIDKVLGNRRRPHAVMMWMKERQTSDFAVATQEELDEMRTIAEKLQRPFLPQDVGLRMQARRSLFAQLPVEEREKYIAMAEEQEPAGATTRQATKRLSRVSSKQITHTKLLLI